MQQLDIREGERIFIACDKVVNAKTTTKLGVIISISPFLIGRSRGCQWLGGSVSAPAMRVWSQVSLEVLHGQAFQKPQSCQPLFGLRWMIFLRWRASSRLFDFCQLVDCFELLLTDQGVGKYFFISLELLFLPLTQIFLLLFSLQLYNCALSSKSYSPMNYIATCQRSNCGPCHQPNYSSDFSSVGQDIDNTRCCCYVQRLLQSVLLL